MKKFAVSLFAVIMLATAACSGSGDKVDDNATDPRVEQPVLNSGPQTEGKRAREAVEDSASAGEDSTIRRDADAPSTPH